MRRVVVTGLGAVSPLGLDVASTWEAILAGKCGIEKITRSMTPNSLFPKKMKKKRTALAASSAPASGALTCSAATIGR